jgi:hypothetical protein
MLDGFRDSVEVTPVNQRMIMVKELDFKFPGIDPTWLSLNSLNV